MICGLETFNRGCAKSGRETLPLGFFKFHAETEAGHRINCGGRDALAGVNVTQWAL